MTIKTLHKSIIIFAVTCLLLAVPQKTYAADGNFNKNKTITISDSQSFGTTGEYTWIQYKPAADGYLTVKASDIAADDVFAKGYLTLYDSTKTKALSSKSIFYNTKNNTNPYWYKITFGLQKNQVYYIRVKALNAVKLSYTYKKVNDKSGDSQVRALSIKKSKAKTGLIPAGSTTGDWYKINITKKQKIRLYYKAKTSGTFRISIYSGTKRLGSKNVYYTDAYKKMTICQYKSSTGKTSGMNPGEYYLRIEKADSLSSGYYMIKWK